MVKPLIQWTWDVGRMVKEAEAVYVATDDDRIADVARDFGADVIMTSESCRNGTERCADAIQRAGLSPDLVINLQGDAPLTPPWFISELARAMDETPELDAATPVLRCDRATLKNFLDDRREGRVGGTTAVFDEAMDALYFSKEVIPHFGERVFPDDLSVPVFHHVGIYAYRPHALIAYSNWREGQLETLEGLEQLRFLENGARLKCVEVDARGRVFWELNNPADIARIEKVLE